MSVTSNVALGYCQYCTKATCTPVNFVAALGTLNICLKFPTCTFNLFQMLRFSPRILRFVDVSKCTWSQSRFYCFQANYVSHPHLVTALDFMYPFCSQSYGRTGYIPMCFTTCDVFRLFLSAISRLVVKIYFLSSISLD